MYAVRTLPNQLRKRRQEHNEVLKHCVSQKPTLRSHTPPTMPTMANLFMTHTLVQKAFLAGAAANCLLGTCTYWHPQPHALSSCACWHLRCFPLSSAHSHHAKEPSSLLDTPGARSCQGRTPPWACQRSTSCLLHGLRNVGIGLACGYLVAPISSHFPLCSLQAPTTSRLLS